MTLATVAAKLQQGGIQVFIHIGMASLGNIRVNHVAHARRITVEVILEIDGAFAHSNNFTEIDHAGLLYGCLRHPMITDESRLVILQEEHGSFRSLEGAQRGHFSLGPPHAARRFRAMGGVL